MSKNLATVARPRPGGGSGIPKVSDGVHSGRKSLRHYFASFSMVGVLGILIIVATILYPGFIMPANLSNIFTQNASVGIIAVGMSFVIISGGFDISVGATYALGATLYAGITLQTGSVPLGLLGGLIGGAIVGSANGLIISKLNINPFVATLGTSSIISGLAYVYSNSAPFIVTSQPSLVPGFQTLALTKIFGMPLPVWVLATVFVVAAIVLSKTTYGRNVYSVGGNYEAAWLSGLRVKGLRGSVYVLTGVLAALAGMMDSSRLGVGQADLGGSMALDAIAIVVIGGTSLLGGEGAIWRSAVGLGILASLTNVFYSLNLSQNWQLIAKGTIVVAAVGVDAAIRLKKRG